MEEYILKAAFVLAFMAYCAVRVSFSRRSKQHQPVRSYRTTAEEMKIFIVWVFMALLPFLCVFTPWFNRFSWDIALWGRVTALVLLALNVGFFYHIHKQLGNNWSPVLEVKEKHQLVTAGVYKYIRHPMYTQCWIWVLLQGIVLGNWLVELTGIVAWGFLYFTRVGHEEKLMLETFGEQYRQYMQRTGRLLPLFFKNR